MERSSAAGARSAAARRDRVHGDYACTKPRPSGDLLAYIGAAVAIVLNSSLISGELLRRKRWDGAER